MVDVVPLLVAQLLRVALGEPLVQDVFDRQANGGAGLLTLLPVEDQLLGAQRREQVTDDLLDLALLWQCLDIIWLHRSGTDSCRVPVERELHGSES